MTQPESTSPGAPEVTVGGQNEMDRLERWQDFGAVWQVASRTASTVTISLCRCDGGEELDQLTSSDPDFLAWLGGRTSSEQNRPA